MLFIFSSVNIANFAVAHSIHSFDTCDLSLDLSLSNIRVEIQANFRLASFFAVKRHYTPTRRALINNTAITCQVYQNIYGDEKIIILNWSCIVYWIPSKLFWSWSYWCIGTLDRIFWVKVHFRDLLLIRCCSQQIFLHHTRMSGATAIISWRNQSESQHIYPISIKYIKVLPGSRKRFEAVRSEFHLRQIPIFSWGIAVPRALRPGDQ